jgi:hypothetical protein
MQQQYDAVKKKALQWDQCGVLICCGDATAGNTGAATVATDEHDGRRVHHWALQDSTSSEPR